jgi:hypothetical protein
MQISRTLYLDSLSIFGSGTYFLDLNCRMASTTRTAVGALLVAVALSGLRVSSAQTRDVVKTTTVIKDTKTGPIEKVKTTSFQVVDGKFLSSCMTISARRPRHECGIVLFCTEAPDNVVSPC